jgi:hypothetical protein
MAKDQKRTVLNPEKIIRDEAQIPRQGVSIFLCTMKPDGQVTRKRVEIFQVDPTVRLGRKGRRYIETLTPYYNFLRVYLDTYNVPPSDSDEDQKKWIELT